ncbi:MAG: hypothetical protein ACRCTJ_05860 [Brevinema sp.]
MLKNNYILASEDSVQRIDPMNPWSKPSGVSESQEISMEQSPQSEINQEVIVKPKSSSLKTFVKKINTIDFFPEKLEHSGYIILASIAVIFSIVLLLLFFRMKKAITETQKNSIALKQMAISLFISQQNFEYKTLLDEFNTSNTTVDKQNTRIQFLNFMNYICKEICEAKDSEFAIKLGSSFISKIQGRFVKMGDLQEVVDYFRFVGEKLLYTKDKDLSGEAIIALIRKDFQKIKKRKK